MTTFRISDDYRPLTWVGRYPVFFTAILVAIHVLALLVLSIAMATGNTSLPVLLAYSSSSVLDRLEVWRLASYAFVHTPTLGFALEMFSLYWVGQEVEKFLGFRSFLRLYIALILAPTVVLTILSPLRESALVGSTLPHLGVFLAFVMIYPGVEFFRIQVRWIALVLVAITALQGLAYRDWAGLTALATVCATSAALLHYFGVNSLVAWIRSNLSRSSPPRRGIQERRREKSAPQAPRDPHDIIDPLLDKIAAKGLASLSASERGKLEEARTALLREDKKR